VVKMTVIRATRSKSMTLSPTTTTKRQRMKTSTRQKKSHAVCLVDSPLGEPKGRLESQAAAALQADSGGLWLTAQRHADSAPKKNA
jgi:hypothetical protein